MARQQKEPLRALTQPERELLLQESRSRSEPASHVQRVKALLAVAEGKNFTQAAHEAGYRVGDSVATLVQRFNAEGVAALQPHHAGGASTRYGLEQTQRILQEVERAPSCEEEGAAVWSLLLLRRQLRQAPNGLPHVSTYTLCKILHEAGYSWQQDRSWLQTGQARRKRKTGTVTVTDPDTTAKKNLIERAYLIGERLGLAVCCQDEAGPYHTIAYPAIRWQMQGDPRRVDPHFERKGVAKLLTLFRPVTGEVRVKGVSQTTNAILHPWLKEQVSQILSTLPEPTQVLSPEENRARWESWREGLTQKVTLLQDLPPLRMLLIWDNIVGHTNAELLCWLFGQGVLPICTPLSGSWLNMAESIQHLLKARALGGQHPTTPKEIMTLFEQTASIWNTHPTSFVWGGKRALRRQRARQRRLGLAGSGAWTPRPIRFQFTALAHYQRVNGNEQSK